MFPHSFGAIKLNTSIEHPIGGKTNPIVQLYLRQDGVTVSVGLLYDDELIPVDAWLVVDPNADDEDWDASTAFKMLSMGSVDITGCWFSLTPPSADSLVDLLDYIKSFYARCQINEYLTELKGEPVHEF
jgi:hypothetical protein